MAAKCVALGGTLNLVKGSFNDYRFGIGLTDVAAQIAGNQGALEIKSFTASAAPGTISMTGTLGVLERGIPVSLKITAHNAQPVVSKLLTANLDANLEIKGTFRERLDIVGSLQLNRTLIGIPNSLPPDVVVLDVHRRGEKTAAAPQRPLVIGLDIAVKAPNQILVKGRGLDAEMGGDLHVRVVVDTPTALTKEQEELLRRLALERGLEAVTADDIAEAANVSVRTFHNYFGSKEEALVAAWRSEFQVHVDALRGRPADEPILVSLELARVVTPARLLHAWRWAVIIIVVVAAVFTPSSDPFSMFALAIPLVAFYFISIGIGKLLGR